MGSSDFLLFMELLITLRKNFFEKCFFLFMIKHSKNKIKDKSSSLFSIIYLQDSKLFFLNFYDHLFLSIAIEFVNHSLDCKMLKYLYL